jgi:UDP-N-acetylglucosamine 1-carboxyvinyltransferase
VANGVTEIEEIERIDRGYEDVVEKFTQLGADIKRVYTPDSVEILKNA